MNKKIVAIIAIACIIIVGGLVGYKVSTNNTVMKLTNNFEARLQVTEAFHDKMWKTLKEKTAITDKSVKAFQDIYIPLMEGRYSQGGKLMQWVKEQNPNFDQSLFKDLMVSVESLRAGFFKEQQLLIAIVEQYKNIRDMIPSSMFCPSTDRTRKMDAFEPITSSRSKDVMKRGMDDETYIK